MISMKNTLRLAAILALPLMVGCQTTADSGSACSNDMVNSVASTDGCFAIDAAIVTPPGVGQPLVIFIHGDSGSSSVSSRRLFTHYGQQLESLNKLGLNTVVLARPGYPLSDGRRTSGYSTADYDNYTPVIVAGIAEAVANLRAHYKPSRVVLLGHSGGAMISGLLAGKHPGTADAAVLVGWGCDTVDWRAWRIFSAGRKGAWNSSLSAEKFLGGVPQSMPMLAITGDKDNNTKPEFGLRCTEQLKARGVPATFTAVPGKGHMDVMSTDEVTKAVLSAAGKPVG